MFGRGEEGDREGRERESERGREGGEGEVDSYAQLEKGRQLAKAGPGLRMVNCCESLDIAILCHIKPIMAMYETVLSVID